MVACLLALLAWRSKLCFFLFMDQDVNESAGIRVRRCSVPQLGLKLSECAGGRYLNGLMPQLR
jgi:hypothetical protein